MIRRILRSAIVLAVLIAAYNAYVVIAVPMMEPPLATIQQRRANQEELGVAATAPSKYQLLLKNYFPKEHWSQSRPPKVIANSTEQVMLVFGDFKRGKREGESPDSDTTTMVDIEQIAILIFPTPPREGILPPRDAVILEAPQGAHLEFDDFRPEIGRIGQIIRGEFPGPIRIHSDMSLPTPDDDLLVETADLHMNTKLMYTSAPVRFKMGENVGGGNELEIRFMSDDHLKPSDPGLKIAGIDSLEIRRNVQMRLAVDTSQLLPGGKDADAKAKQAKNKPYAVNPSVQTTDARGVPPAAPKAPVEVTCTGPFTFDFVRYVASLDRDVELRQINPNGPSNLLVCSRLDIHFAPKLKPAGAASSGGADPEKRQQRDLGQLEPVAVVAEGHPVVVTSPEQKAQARGDRIQIALRDQRVRISGGADAMLMFGPNVIQAPIIDYQQPAKEEATKIGQFRATGPGSLRYLIDENKPDQVLQAQWQTSVQLGREKGQPVLALDGRPKIAFGPTGTLTADQIRLYLRELEGAGTVGIPIGGNNKGDSGDAQKKITLAPDRLLATGQVEVASPTFTGRVKQLSTTFRIDPSATSADKKDKPAAPGGSNPAGAPNNGETSQYLIDAEQMKLEVLLKGRATVPHELECDGYIVLREIPLVATNQQPLEVRGGRLKVTQMETQAPQIVLSGTGVGPAPGAQIVGRGMSMMVDTLQADGGNSHVWSDGPGKATITVQKDIQGGQAAQPFPMDVVWAKGFSFDGQTIVFDENVVITGMESKLGCDRLAAKLASKVQIGKQFNQANMNPSELECSGRVTIENVSRDAGGLTSRVWAQLDRLSINQQTGAINGIGPGVIRATRLGNGMGAISVPFGAKPPAATVAAAPAEAVGNKLYFLRVDFHRGLAGNMYLRELTFHDRIRTVYGPVDSWEQELDISRPESLPPDTMTLTCDQLRLNEDPLAARVAATPGNTGKRPLGPMQMRADGDVRISGQIPGQGDFSVQAETASYEPAPKDVFQLEGSPRTPARLWRRTNTGETMPPLEANKIRYVRSTNQVQIKEIQFFEITPKDVQSAGRPKAPAK